MVSAQPAIEQIWDWLKEVADPEVPVLSVVDLGIVRDVQWIPDARQLVITVTPTYCGCPAMDAITADMRSMLAKHGIERVEIRQQLSPAWTTDWISGEAKARLLDFGIAPPANRAVDVTEIVPAVVACPRCRSRRTEVLSRFGSTACKALYRCLDCLEPFDVFKQH